MSARIRKSTTPTATKKAAPAKAVKAVQAVPAEDGAKDWTYLQDKDPSSLHAALAQMIQDEVGVEIDPKSVQLVLALHGTFQRSDENKKRAEYRPLHQEIVRQRSVHMTLAHQEAAPIVAKDRAKATTPAKKATPAKKTAKATPAKRTPAKRVAKSA